MLHIGLILWQYLTVMNLVTSEASNCYPKKILMIKKWHTRAEAMSAPNCANWWGEEEWKWRRGGCGEREGWSSILLPEPPAAPWLESCCDTGSQDGIALPRATRAHLLMRQIREGGELKELERKRGEGTVDKGGEVERGRGGKGEPETKR